MPRLSASDFRAVLAFLHFAHENASADPFPPIVLDELRRLVPAETVHYGEWRGGEFTHFGISTPDRETVLAVWTAYPEVRADDPLPGGPGGDPVRERTPIGRAVKFSDVLTVRQLRALGLHAAVCKPLGIDYVMKLFLPTPAGMGSTFVFDRARRDFTERDRLVLDLLLPHLVQLRNAAWRRDERRAVARRLTPREQEILALVARGK